MKAAKVTFIGSRADLHSHSLAMETKTFILVSKYTFSTTWRQENQQWKQVVSSTNNWSFISF